MKQLFWFFFPMPWPELPAELKPGCAYGVLKIRNENNRLRQSVLARVDLETGALYPEMGLSRDGYDWCYDSFEFQVHRSKVSVPVEEGEELSASLDFCVNTSQLQALGTAWTTRRQKALHSSLSKTGLPRPKRQRL